MESSKKSLDRDQFKGWVWIRRRWKAPVLSVMIILLHFSTAHASMFKGDTLDKVSDVLAWVVLIVAPLIGIIVFWLVHILPEKIAEKKQHPQAKAIQTLCILSLFFGGMLWPLAWLWAYSKPVLYQLAYGTDKVPHDHDQTDQDLPETAEPGEVVQLRERIAELENKLVAVKAATE